MMQRSTLTIFLSLVFTLCGFAQVEEGKSPFLILQSGAGLKYNNTLHTSFLLSAEKPVGKFCHLGVQWIWYSSEQEDWLAYDSYSAQKDLGGFEVGAFAKFFLHGRLSGRKSNLYFSPEVRVGAHRFEGYFYGDFDPGGRYDYSSTQQNQKYLVRCGAQWIIGQQVVIEVALPLGWEHSKIVSKTAYNQIEYPNPSHSFDRFVMLPTMQLGFAF